MMRTYRKVREDTKVIKSSEVGAGHSLRLNEAELRDATQLVFAGITVAALQAA